ncbi:MAG: HAD-IA family hydrolase [Myxococcota bacterium]|nr:HAD-IA family hydrolase [Myxococcota bacterium]
MSQHIQTIAFDLDGTLVNSLEDIRTACNLTLSELGHPQKTSKDVRAMIGHGVTHLLTLALGSNEQELIARAKGRFGPHYYAHVTDTTKLYPGFVETLDTLRANGYDLLIATNKPAHFTQKLVEALSLNRWFSGIASADEVARRKPADDVIRLACERGGLDFSPETLAYVGDMKVDLQAAENAGCFSIYAEWGFGPSAAPYKADHSVSSPKNLLRLFDEEKEK